MQRPVEMQASGQTLRGMLHAPEPGSTSGLGILFLHGWSGCKLGPHRMFVKAARAMEKDGHTCLRFDFRGRGDSDELEPASIRSMVEDAGCALTELLQQSGVQRAVVLGICSGGKVAVMLAASDDRVRDLVLWSAEALAPLRARDTRQRKTMHALRQYGRKLLSASTWKKLLTGKANLSLVRKAVLEHEMPDSLELADEAAAFDRFRNYSGHMLSVYGANDPETRSSAAGYRTFCRDNAIALEHHEVTEANHSFYSLEWEGEVISVTRAWLRELVR